MTGGPAPALARFAPWLRVLVVLLAAIAGWWLAGAGGARALTAILGAGAALVAVGFEVILQAVEPRRVLGAIAGLVAAVLILRLIPTSAWQALSATGVPGGAIVAILGLSLGWLGLVLGARQLGLLEWPRSVVAAQPATPKAERLEASSPAPKVVDTSVIIDGRIQDVVQSGFVEGPLVVPLFVIRELQQVADSSDPLKRARGRKGLDALKALQESDRIEVELLDQDFPELDDVDGKLLALAEELGGKVLTNDYNLNKVAQLRGVLVLNVNDLANAVKPVVLPGESLSVQVIKEGKERNQGVGYLDDGTMIVVDNAGDRLGQRMEVLVTSVIQTNAGKMIFASPDEEQAEVRPRVARRDGRSNAPQADSGSGIGPST